MKPKHHGIVCVAVSILCSNCSNADSTYDIVVYGGTSGGVVAAVQSARLGKSVVLIEPTKFLGGLTTGGLGATDIGNKRAIGGISREFYQRVFQHYQAPETWRFETRDEYFAKRSQSGTHEDSQWTFEPSVALKIYQQMIEEAKVAVVYGERLNLKTGVTKTGARITKITMESGRTFFGKVFIDTTYEGDLMAASGVKYHVGREPNSKYNETINGLQMAGAVHHQFVKPVDAYNSPGNPSSGLLPGVTEMPKGQDGDGDHRIQAYNYRMCTTDEPTNRRDWPKPAGYDEHPFELLLRNFEAGDLRIPWAPIWMPNRKTDTNNNFAFSTDHIGMNYDYPDADYATRERIIAAHINYQQGLMWTLANNPRVPMQIRQVFQRIGLTKDEFTDNDNWPRQLYVREARRMVSEYVMSEKNCKRQEVVPDSVGMGAYNMDSHNTQRYVTSQGFARNEGDIQIGTRPYPISYRSIRPQAEDCANLLVPVCLAASHIAYGSIRMEPVFMVLGQSAATAASLAVDDDCAVQEVDYQRLQTQLLTDSQVLDFESPVQGTVIRLKKEDFVGFVVDDSEAERIGFTSVGQTVSPFIGQGYAHDDAERKGEQSVKFIPDLPKAGKYRVAIGYTSHANRADKVPVIVHSDSESKTFLINQQQTPPEKGLFLPLGVFEFSAGKSGFVEVRNEGTVGHVVVDAVQFLPQLP